LATGGEINLLAQSLNKFQQVKLSYSRPNNNLDYGERENLFFTKKQLALGDKASVQFKRRILLTCQLTASEKNE